MAADPIPGTGEPADRAGLTRRDWLERVATRTGAAALGASALLGLGANTYFLFPQVLYEPARRFKIGRAGDYPVGEVVLRKEHGIFVAREERGIGVLLAKCTHLGCLPRFAKDEGVFKCPCHGSVFSREGDPLAGPAPEPLFHVAVRASAGGELEVDVSRRENRPEERGRPPFFLEVAT